MRLLLSVLTRKRQAIKTHFLGVLLFACSALSQTNARLQYVTDIYAGVPPSPENGPVNNVLLDVPTGIGLDTRGNLLIAERTRISVADNGTLRSFANVAPQGTLKLIARPDAIYGITGVQVLRFLNNRVETIAGSTNPGTATGDNGPATQAQFLSIADAIISTTGEIYLADSSQHRIRRITTDGIIRTIAGNGTAATSGNGLPAASSSINGPTAIAFDQTGRLVFWETNSGSLRRIESDGALGTVARFSSGLLGFSLVSRPAGDFVLSIGESLLAISPDGSFSLLSARPLQGNPLRTEPSTYFSQLILDAENRVLALDRRAKRVLRLSTTGLILDAYAGRSRQQLSDVRSELATFNSPGGLACATDGTIYVADAFNYMVRAVRPDGTTKRILGTGISGSATGTSGSGLDRPLAFANRLALARSGALWVADAEGFRPGEGFRILKLEQNGTVRSVAGNGIPGSSGNGMNAATGMVGPTDLTVLPDDRVVFSERQYSVLRTVGTDENLAPFAGVSGSTGNTGDGGAATAARLAMPNVVGANANGVVRFVDQLGTRLREVSSSGVIRTIAGQGRGSLGIYRVTLPGADWRLPLVGSLGGSIDGGTLVGAYNAIYLVDSAGRVGLFAGNTRPLTGVSVTPTVAPDAQFGLIGGICEMPTGDVYASDSTFGVIRRFRANPKERLEFGGSIAGVPGGSARLTARVLGKLGFGIVEEAVRFRIVRGDAILDKPEVLTDNTGLAVVQLSLGSSAQAVEVEAVVDGLPRATVLIDTRPAPITLSPQAIVGAGDGLAPINAVTPGGLVTIYAPGFLEASAPPVLATVDNGTIPDVLGGWCVLVNGRRAPLLHVYPSQVTIQVPWETETTAPARVQARKDCTSTNERASAEVLVPSAAAAPQWFLFRHTSASDQPVAAIDATTGVLIGPAGLYGSAIPARVGQIITVFGTGFGNVNGTVATGRPPAAPAQVTATVTLQLGGEDVARENILYVGITPGLLGVYQLNLRVPGNANGKQQLTLRIGTSTPTQGGTLEITP